MVNDSTIVVGSFDKHLYMLSSKGELIKKYDADGKIFSSPIVLENGNIVCSTVDGKVHFVSIVNTYRYNNINSITNRGKKNILPKSGLVNPEILID